MDTAQLLEQVNDVVESLFSGGSRYQMEKIVTVVVYAIISVASLIWAFSGGNGGNELGAKFKVEALTEVDDQNFHLINDGDEWTNVRVVLNQKFLWTSPKVEGGRQTLIRPKDFSYYYYIPRPWGRHPWELLSKTPKPGPKAPSTMKVHVVQIHANEGGSDIKLDSSGNPLPKGKPAENVAKAP